MSWKISEEIVGEVEELKYIRVWVDRKLQGNVQLDKMEKRHKMDEQSE